MTSPHFVQVEEWQQMLRVWLAFGAIWLRNWILEGAGTLEEGFWSFAGTLELPFGVEDAPDLRRELQGSFAENYREDISARLRLQALASTQIPEPWQLDPPPADARGEGSNRPRGLRTGPRNPDDGRPYPGIGLTALETRL